MTPLLVFLLLTSAAPEPLASVQARELTAALASVERGDEHACRRLDEALTYFWAPWGSDEIVQWPRVWRTPIPESLGAWRSAADACVAKSTSEDLTWLVASGLLRSEELHARALAGALAQQRVTVTEDGGLEYRDPGAFYPTGLRKPELVQDPTTAPATVTGARFDAELARRLIRQNRGQVVSCYERYADPHLEGDLVVRFALAAGRDTAVVALEKTTVANSRLEACVMTRAARWVWPGKTAAVVSYPFHFAPGADAR
jgi:hypothetical protein